MNPHAKTLLIDLVLIVLTLDAISFDGVSPTPVQQGAYQNVYSADNNALVGVARAASRGTWISHGQGPTAHKNRKNSGRPRCC
jgi:hypothetical protein